MATHTWQNRWRGGDGKRIRPEAGRYSSPVNRIPPDPPPTSLVLLLREPRALDAATLGDVVSQALGAKPLGGNGDGESCVVGESPHFLFEADGCVYAVHNVPHPYFDNPAAVAAETSELRLRKAVTQHRAWLAVDLLEGNGAAVNPYRTIGKVIAALAGPDCLAVCVPEQRHIYPYEESVAEKLRGPDPLAALASAVLPPVLGVSADDPALRAAVQEARRRWPEFVAAFEQREPGQMFSVKVPMRDSKMTEYMWVSVSALENGMIYGRLDNEPVELKRLRSGDQVRVPVAELNDWLYTRGDLLAGGFTIDVLSRLPKRPPRQ
jgi:uncharacterized protein YegJ (DUF2314 family)